MDPIFVLTHSMYKRPASLMESHQPGGGESCSGGFALLRDRRALG